MKIDKKSRIECTTSVDDGVCFVLNLHVEVDFDDISSMKEKSLNRHVTPHINLIQSQPVFGLTPLCCVLSGEAANINFIVISLT
jgi:hypothetical protein